jgi:two-component system, chemotaxis family, sensor kinase CheA
MKTRMQPIDTVWSALPRMVRDLMLQSGKTVRLEMEGSDTELDKSLIEAIKDPLTHLVRNAIDHGLELPEVRVAAGKSPEGRLLLRAFHEGGQVNIEISDDGAGIGVSAVVRKAVERGVITLEQARQMNDQEAMNLIFLPGFSTADTITSISGRGVGMDVVKTNIERIGGKVSIYTERGRGTTFKIRIPLTLAILPALVVSSSAERYAIPQVNVLELVRLEGDEARKKIERIHEAAVYRLRGELLPLISLNAELSGENGAAGSSVWIDRIGDAANIVVLQADGRKFGLMVDDVIDTQEIVVKPLGKQLRSISIFAGATIMGDGRVALILDALAFAVHAQVLAESHNATPVGETAIAPAETTEALLLFSGPDDRRMAVRLSQAMRLEEFERKSLERAGDRNVVQYRGDIMPLVRLSELLALHRPHTGTDDRACNADETIQTIVYSKNGRRLGVVVDRIVDTIEEALGNLGAESSGRAATSAVIQGRVTEILDLDVLCADVESPAVATRGCWGAVA